MKINTIDVFRDGGTLSLGTDEGEYEVKKCYSNKPEHGQIINDKGAVDVATARRVYDSLASLPEGYGVNLSEYLVLICRFYNF